MLDKYRTFQQNKTCNKGKIHRGLRFFSLGAFTYCYLLPVPYFIAKYTLKTGGFWVEILQNSFFFKNSKMTPIVVDSAKISKPPNIRYFKLKFCTYVDPNITYIKIFSQIFLKLESIIFEFLNKMC
jgi:hypothetical protein